MLNVRCARKLLGILTLISWGVFAYFAISEAVDELPPRLAVLAIAGICLPLFIPLLLLSSEEFWAKHKELSTILGLIWGVLAALGGLIISLMLVFVLSFPNASTVGYSTGEFASYTIMWILVAILLWADAIVLFMKVTRR